MEPVFAADFPALGSMVRILVTDPAALAAARRAVESEVAALDLACSRFRDDSELAAVNRAGGRPVRVGALLFEALEAACWAGRETEGLVDPTVGRAMEEIGYEGDFASVLARSRDEGRGASHHRAADTTDSAQPTRGWQVIDLDRTHMTVSVPAGVRLDLGATAKALGADRAARAAWEATGSAAGVLVSLGGDLASMGPVPEGGWSVRVTDDHRAGPNAPGQTIRLRTGGLATSSVVVRHWTKGPRSLHHILDPTTGRPAPIVWRTVSVAAATCLQANAASTAAVILGERALSWLSARSLPARLVRRDGVVVRVADWPEDD
jgi:thiamine biosynthesis lipoprotein